VLANGLAYLTAYGEYGIKRSHWILGYEGNIFASDTIHFPIAQLQQVIALE